MEPAPRDYRVPMNGLPAALRCRFETPELALSDAKCWADYDSQLFLAQDMQDRFFWFTKADSWAWGYYRRGEVRKVWRVRRVVKDSRQLAQSKKLH